MKKIIDIPEYPDEYTIGERVLNWLKNEGIVLGDPDYNTKPGKLIIEFIED